MIQHDLRKLLGYHAVSQVGYMVLGIGTGSIIGIAGGLFHMLNHSIYKSCLFFCGGSVEHKTGTNELEKLGGLAGQMPLTFVSCFIAALSISGIPPLNGFFSKWMIYQGVISMGKTGNASWVLWIVAAMFGSALTLASFAKLIHAVFLGQKSSQYRDVKEVSFPMWIPMVALALLCVTFGVFAQALPIKHFIQPAMNAVYSSRVSPLEIALTGEAAKVTYSGIWWSGWATLMILGGVILGLVIYLLGNLKGFRGDNSYVGGEILAGETRVTGVDFYGTVKDIPLFRRIYALAEAKTFDLYEQGKKLTFCISDKLKEAHTGILRTYLAWCLIGLLVILLYLMTQI
jgi:NADH:ubiquinone oxidoreductase subunit 5 (subunit L)/multisubunit Na+/H+ antiporter MnhA subunit